ncbi:hypothetical protein INT47_001284 [Mucor saturninus]|uniref:Uncharacterized protein n=1 Tax=Mucor saturninus TaxID=64648 RepID=A0A8H7VEZ7_9FUNG|nr:hypothetical protein INT47_001284 [Mucor saturninus]
MQDLGPPPAPKPVTMPPMSPEDKKKFGGGGGGGGGAPAAHVVASPMPMMASPMPMMGGPMMMGGCPTVGGMGPNLVFNFNQPYGMGMPMYGAAPVAVVAEAGCECKEEKPPAKECPPIQVQGDPTWTRPRLVVKKGAKLKDDPCVIM